MPMLTVIFVWSSSFILVVVLAPSVHGLLRMLEHWVAINPIRREWQRANRTQYVVGIGQSAHIHIRIVASKADLVRAEARQPSERVLQLLQVRRLNLLLRHLLRGLQSNGVRQRQGLVCVAVNNRNSKECADDE